MEPVPIDGSARNPGQNQATEVVIVASAFGVDAIRRDGHLAWLGAAAEAGATGFEVRRELFGLDAEASPEGLALLGRAIARLGMWSVYSTPASLYREDGTLGEAALKAALAEADALGARFVKLQLGAFGGRADGVRLRNCVAGSRARLVVENGQVREGGSLGQFVSLFAALEREEAAGALGMTFDIGNWQWTDEAPREAAKSLAAHVEYIHCKGVAGEGARRFAVAPAEGDPLCTELFATLPRHAPRGIEFPFDVKALAADARRRVAWLAAL
ncbi:sugar phosphate isomerase/epimerase [Trinickia terrae]|uniref:Sugar phosphate isomerase/epimerase n=1 Tax=Trinickia terrae TaxID=2571161 RepID=A0A4U1IA26_9BURK|nr:TIM barrel protein [Trinickia terrae]TKC90287.1 sugar phosphate isomerase/epimerase [Trinickia terrae]